MTDPTEPQYPSRPWRHAGAANTLAQTAQPVRQFRAVRGGPRAGRVVAGFLLLLAAVFLAGLMLSLSQLGQL